MELQRLLGPRLLLLFFVGCLVFGYPILDLFSQHSMVAGVPLLYVYLFAVWAVFIALVAWLVEGPGLASSIRRQSRSVKSTGTSEPQTRAPR